MEEAPDSLCFWLRFRRQRRYEMIDRVIANPATPIAMPALVPLFIPSDVDGGTVVLKFVGAGVTTGPERDVVLDVVVLAV